MPLLGVIADDFTGATDISSFLTENGLSVIQINGDYLSSIKIKKQIDAVVISLKTRSCPVKEAVNSSLIGLKWLKELGIQKYYFKYCSTFDSTDKGNIGQVADAMLKELGETQTIICPSLPVNKRTVYNGYLFIGEKLLHESHMKNHPLNPMTDSSIVRMMARQSRHRVSLINLMTLHSGKDVLDACIKELDSENYVVIDALTDGDLDIIAETFWNRMNLFTGGSGLGGAIARHLNKNKKNRATFTPPNNQTAIISGSCSNATLEQICYYQNYAPSCPIKLLEYILNPDKYIDNLIQWYKNNNDGPYAPLIYAGEEKADIEKIQKKLGLENTQDYFEKLISSLTGKLAFIGVKNYIIAGGETSGVAARELRIKGFYIGIQIAPGVPWVKSMESDYYLALKSGNFGDKAFFKTAQEFYL
ncbi:MAG: hypothetical protein B0D92_08515 [Spirochaeta sp. LUC14_002_19_P3]|nr:MAG: hypothetical protein B0D92_08515 [Spirochaeta sp. LUC14_002_19_P3]